MIELFAFHFTILLFLPPPPAHLTCYALLGLGIGTHGLEVGGKQVQVDAGKRKVDGAGTVRPRRASRCPKQRNARIAGVSPYYFPNLAFWQVNVWEEKT